MLNFIHFSVTALFILSPLCLATPVTSSELAIRDDSLADISGVVHSRDIEVGLFELPKLHPKLGARNSITSPRNHTSNSTETRGTRRRPRHLARRSALALQNLYTLSHGYEGVEAATPGARHHKSHSLRTRSAYAPRNRLLSMEVPGKSEATQRTKRQPGSLTIRSTHLPLNYYTLSMDSASNSGAKRLGARSPIAPASKYLYLDYATNPPAAKGAARQPHSLQRRAALKPQSMLSGWGGVYTGDNFGTEATTSGIKGSARRPRGLNRRSSVRSLAKTSGWRGVQTTDLMFGP